VLGDLLLELRLCRLSRAMCIMISQKDGRKRRVSLRAVCSLIVVLVELWCWGIVTMGGRCVSIRTEVREWVCTLIALERLRARRCAKMAAEMG